MTHATRSASRDHRRILVVVDGGLVPGSVPAALGAIGDIVRVRDAAGALEALAGPGARFDIVISGCSRSSKPPHAATCLLFVRTVFRRWPWIPMILVGGDVRPLLGEVLATGVRRVLRAPLRGPDLSAAIRRLVPARGTPRPGGPATIAKIKRVLAYLSDDAAEIPALGHLAAMTTMSPSHFSHVFHAVTGLALRDYVRNLRLQRAHALLLHSTLSMTSVALEAGFYDLPHFDKTFRRHFECSPRRFRALYTRPGNPRR